MISKHKNKLMSPTDCMITQLDADLSVINFGDTNRKGDKIVKFRFEVYDRELIFVTPEYELIDITTLHFGNLREAFETLEKYLTTTYLVFDIGYDELLAWIFNPFLHVKEASQDAYVWDSKESNYTRTFINPRGLPDVLNLINQGRLNIRPEINDSSSGIGLSLSAEIDNTPYYTATYADISKFPTVEEMYLHFAGSLQQLIDKK